MIKEVKEFEEIFRAKSPLATDGFGRFLQEVKEETDPESLNPFFLHLNEELYRTLWRDPARDTTPVEEMIQKVGRANPEIMVQSLKRLMDEMRLHRHDPLVGVLFRTAGQDPALHPLVSDLLRSELQFLEIRGRTLETLFMRLLREEASAPVTAGADRALHLLNRILYDLNKEPWGVKKLEPGLSEQLKAVRQVLSGAGMYGGRYARIDGLVRRVLERFAAGPGDPEFLLSVWEILKAGDPMPEWYAPDASSAGPFRDRLFREGMQFITALIVDKAIRIVLTETLARWESRVPGRAGPSAERTTTRLEPANPALVGSVLLDQNSPLKVRRLAAALLRLLKPAHPISSRLVFYSDLFLMPLFQTGPVPLLPERRVKVSIIRAEEEILYLLEALGEKSDHVRWKASKACFQAVQDHPGWFLPRHHVQLLPLLSDDNDLVRSNIVRVLRVLSSQGPHGMVPVIREISEKLGRKAYRVDDPKDARPELETALAGVFDSLNRQVDDLQRRLQQLESKRKTLLALIEKQAMSIGEEIHHEILNTRCGYLATAIDEEAYAEAAGQMKELAADLRRIMNHLYPRDLEVEGFLATLRMRLEEAGRQMQKRTAAFSVEFRCSPGITDETVLECLRDGSHGVLLYRVILEAIVNARKHSRGTYIAIDVSRSGAGSMDISIRDNGRGNGGPFQENVGLSLMRQRIEEIGGRMEYGRTSQEGGTTVTIRLSKYKRPAAPRE